MGSWLLFKLLPAGVWRRLFQDWLQTLASQEAKIAMHRLLEVESDLAGAIDQVALRYDNGVHVKHRLMRYHDFFIERIQAGERVLDIGCGKGELAYDIAVQAKAFVTGIDFDANHLSFAKSNFKHSHLAWIEGDALDYPFTESFDVVVLSNVLEHIEQRVEFLQGVQKRIDPQRFLIRVPAIDRHWLVPLRKELGLFYFSDRTHYTEYTKNSFEAELRAANLEIVCCQFNWGEIWAEAKSKVLAS